MCIYKNLCLWACWLFLCAADASVCNKWQWVVWISESVIWKQVPASCTQCTAHPVNLQIINALCFQRRNQEKLLWLQNAGLKTNRADCFLVVDCGPGGIKADPASSGKFVWHNSFRFKISSSSHVSHSHICWCQCGTIRTAPATNSCFSTSCQPVVILKVLTIVYVMLYEIPFISSHSSLRNESSAENIQALTRQSSL